MELQKILTDESMRCETLKHNYKALHAEYTSLQNVLTQKQVELKQLLSVKRSHQGNLVFLLAELQDSSRNLEELKLQVMNPQWLERLRAQLQQEMQLGPAREHFNKLEEEMQRYRAEHNKLRFEYISLKSQFDHNVEESERVLNERKIHFDAEIASLERDKEDLVARYKCFDLSRDKKRVEALLKERVQLHVRLKGLEEDAGELCGQRDNKGQQVENMQHIHIRQMAESQLTVKSLEAERQSLRRPLERLERELQHSHKQNTQLTGRLHKAEREVNSLTFQVESMKHTHKLEMANIKLERARYKGAEREALQMQIDGLQSDVEVLKGTVKRQQEMLAEKDREPRKVQGTHKEQFNKTWLDNCLAEKEQRWVMQRAESAHKEVLSLKTKLQQQHQSHLKDVERQKAEIDQLKRQNQKLGVQLGTLSRSQSDLVETNKHLSERLDRVREELRTTKVEAERSQREAEKLVEDHRARWLEEERKLHQKNKYGKDQDRLQSAIQAQETGHTENEKSQHEPEKPMENHHVEWLEEKHKLQQTVSELQNKYGKAKDKLQRAAQAQTKRESHKEKEKRLQDKIQLLEAKIVEFELEVKAAERRASYSEDHFSGQLKDLQRRHGEFQYLLFGNPIPSGQSPAFMTSSSNPLHIP